jgi:hypothetical protein
MALSALQQVSDHNEFTIDTNHLTSRIHPFEQVAEI